MPDKLTDNEIVKALESRMFKENKYMFSLIESTLDLINRLQAENERLGKELLEQKLKNNMLYETAKEIEAEAYKEVAEKIDATTWYHINKNGELVMGANSETDIPLFKAEDVFNLLKELVGEDK